MVKLIVLALAASCFTAGLLCAQTVNLAPGSVPSSATPLHSSCTFTAEPDWQWISCSPNGKILEQQSVILPAEVAASAKPADIVFSGEKSSIRIAGVQVITVKFRSLENVLPEVGIGSLKVENGVRKTDLNAIGRRCPVDLRWTQVNKTTIQLTPLAPLPPGEYVVFARSGDGIKNGDEAFLFGVD